MSYVPLLHSVDFFINRPTDAAIPESDLINVISVKTGLCGVMSPDFLKQTFDLFFLNHRRRHTGDKTLFVLLLYRLVYAELLPLIS